MTNSYWVDLESSRQVQKKVILAETTTNWSTVTVFQLKWEHQSVKTLKFLRPILGCPTSQDAIVINGSFRLGFPTGILGRGTTQGPPPQLTPPPNPPIHSFQPPKKPGPREPVITSVPLTAK